MDARSLIVFRKNKATLFNKKLRKRSLNKVKEYNVVYTNLVRVDRKKYYDNKNLNNIVGI